MKKAFCPICGELEIKDGKIIHPTQDKFIADILNNGYKSTYIYPKIINYIELPSPTMKI